MYIISLYFPLKKRPGMIYSQGSGEHESVITQKREPTKSCVKTYCSNNNKNKKEKNFYLRIHADPCGKSTVRYFKENIKNSNRGQ
jgi:hypothetical protein